MIRPILSLGDERLVRVSSSVDVTELPATGPWIEDLRDTLVDVLASNPKWGQAGLSAVQVGILKRICLLWFRDTGFKILVNPEIVDQGGEVTYHFENCLSISHLRVRVPRSHWVMARFQDRGGDWHEERFEAKAARLVLHEIDHTNGVLCLQRMEAGDRPLTVAEYEEMIARSSPSLSGDSHPRGDERQ